MVAFSPGSGGLRSSAAAEFAGSMAQGKLRDFRTCMGVNS